MLPNIGDVIASMIDYNHGCPELINHALKVYAFAKGIGEKEEITREKMKTLETAAVLHDIGIRVSEEKYESFSGKYQQIEGPPIARELLTKLEFDKKIIDRVCFLIAHHHEYDAIDDLDYQILVEADFLVNLYEEHPRHRAINAARNSVFKTKTGREFLDSLFNRSYPKPSLFAADLKKRAMEAE